MAESDLIQTGIYGLDKIFLGGILKGNVVVVEGAAGVGKTLLGLEFIYRGITEHDEPGIIVTRARDAPDRQLAGRRTSSSTEYGRRDTCNAFQSNNLRRPATCYSLATF